MAASTTHAIEFALNAIGQAPAKVNLPKNPQGVEKFVALAVAEATQGKETLRDIVAAIRDVLGEDTNTKNISRYVKADAAAVESLLWLTDRLDAAINRKPRTVKPKAE